jgi:hypothetical protein
MANSFSTFSPKSTGVGDSPNRVLSLTTDSPGLLDRLHFKDCFVYPIPLKDDEVEYRVHATGLNFFDAMPAMGEVPIAKFGGEASGVVTQAGPNVKRVRTPRTTYSRTLSLHWYFPNSRSYRGECSYCDTPDNELLTCCRVPNYLCHSIPLSGRGHPFEDRGVDSNTCGSRGRCRLELLGRRGSSCYV